MNGLWMVLILMLAGGAKDSKLEWHSATVVDAQHKHSFDGIVNLSVDQVDLDDGDAVWVAKRTVVRTETWEPPFQMKVEFAVDGKKLFVRGPGLRKTIEMKLIGRYPRSSPLK